MWRAVSERADSKDNKEREESALALESIAIPEDYLCPIIQELRTCMLKALSTYKS